MELKNCVTSVIKDKGLWGTLLLSLIILCLFYGKILIHPNKVFFSKDGDGLQSYYTTIYHIKYDSTYSHFQGMNYPYGEHVVFTNCQPVISNTLKFISQNIIDVSGYAVGVINLVMLLSIVIAAVFLYLLLKEFDLNRNYSMFVAVGIAYLSPLLNRFYGHYSLSYVFTIPVVLYVLTRFYKVPSWGKSLALGIFIFVMATFHIYNLAFAAFILGFFWLGQIFTDKKFRKLIFLLLHISLQIILPILIINIWLWLTNSVSDRTSYPWGFLVFKSGWEGVFLQHPDIPIPFLSSYIHTNPVDWEGWAYIGHLASIFYFFIFTLWSCIPFFKPDNLYFFLAILFIGIVIQLFRRKRWKLFNVVDNKQLSVFLWTGLIALLFSFAWPFNFYPQWLGFAGPIKQFRGIGRFSWIFYYTINIGVFYFLYHIKFLRKYARFTILVISVIILYRDAYKNNFLKQALLNNNIPELTATSNIDDMIKTMDCQKYQAIIPIPFFHVGSENTWLQPSCNSSFNSFIFSLKTGLPITAVLMSRTSISQTYNNLSVVNEPYRPLEMLKQCRSEKPFRSLVTECDKITSPERKLILKAKLISKGDHFSLYELKKEKLETVADSLYFNAAAEMSKRKLFAEENCYSTDPALRFINKSFDDNQNDIAYNGKGCFTGKIKEYNVIFEGTLPNALPDSDYVCSFWFGKVHHDVYPRTTIEVACSDNTGNVYRADYYGAQSLFKIINGDWALVEFQFCIKNKNDKLKITLWNDDLTKKDTLFIDELLIKPAGNTVFKEINKSAIMRNNRLYKKK